MIYSNIKQYKIREMIINTNMMLKNIETDYKRKKALKADNLKNTNKLGKDMIKTLRGKKRKKKSELIRHDGCSS